MLNAKNDEEKRSTVWRYVTCVSTILIIIIAAYFIYDGFAGNPLEGTWIQDESDVILEIKKNNEAVLIWEKLVEGETLEVKLEYKLDKRAKQITFKGSSEEFQKAAEGIGNELTAAEVKSAVSTMLTSFNYSMERSELTLTEWDYGEQLLFTKRK